MLIKLSPQFSSAAPPSVFVDGDVLLVGGQEFDFSDLTGPVEPGPPFVGPVYREEGRVVVTLVLPHGLSPSSEQAFPDDIEIEEGEVALPASPPEPDPEPLTLDQHQTILKAEVQSWMNAKVAERNYDSITSLCTYATDPDPVFAAEGQAGVAWRSAVWRVCYLILAEVVSDERPVPTRGELLAELPAFVWPDEAVPAE